MNLQSHPKTHALATWVNSQLPNLGTLDEILYRVAGPNHTTAADFVSGIGARKGGGRWNVPEKMLVVYLSRKSVTAISEAEAHYHYYGLRPPTTRVVVAVVATMDKVLDLTQANVAHSLPLPLADLLGEDWRALMKAGKESAAQALAGVAFHAGIRALLVPSRADPTGVNLVVFRENLPKNCRLEVLNPDELDKIGNRT